MEIQARGWDVAGITEATNDHTLVRKCELLKEILDWTTLLEQIH